MPSLELVNEARDAYNLPFPTNGKTYIVSFVVGHVGPNYDDTPDYSFAHASEEVRGALEGGLSFTDLFDAGELPIASGTYAAVITFWQEDISHWEDTHPEYDYGFTVKRIWRLFRPCPLYTRLFQ